MRVNAREMSEASSTTREVFVSIGLLGADDNAVTSFPASQDGSLKDVFEAVLQRKSYNLPNPGARSWVPWSL